ncbi:MAG: beta-lactamase family protein [Actinobacteria bacterium]|nr:beta-lactamase family protein [Actinomycetota bacterium]
MSVLAKVDDWPVDTVAVGVTDAEDTLDRHGPTDRPFPLASVTKLLTAMGTLVAVQDGLVHLDEPAGPDGSTVRHLLAHASGMPPSEGGPSSPVGKRRVYSTPAYEVLGDLVADRVGLPFAEHVDLEVCRPLGMTATRITGSPGRDGGGSVDDLLALGRELLAPTILDDELFAEATTPVFPDLSGVLPGFGRQDPNPWGLGFEIRGEKSPHWTGSRNSPATFGHFGQSGSFLWVDPDAGLACAELGDRAFDEWAAQAWPPLSDAVLETHA